MRRLSQEDVQNDERSIKKSEIDFETYPPANRRRISLIPQERNRTYIMWHGTAESLGRGA